jgi:hypothetical protein
MRGLVLATSFATGFAGMAAGARAQTSLGPDILSPRAIAMGEALRAAASGALATTLNPAGIVLTRSYVLEGSYGYRPDDHANIQSVSICDSVTTRVGACLYYDHLSGDLTLDGAGSRYRHEVGLSMAVPLADGLSIGVTNKYVSYSEQPPDVTVTDLSHTGYLLDAGLNYRLMPSLSVAFVGYNLIGGDQGVFARALGFGAAWNLSPQILVAADGRYDLERDVGRWGGGAEYLISGAEGQQGFPLRLGYVYDSGLSASYLTGGLGFMTPRVAVDVGARKQVSRGDELLVQFSLRVFLPN